MDDDDGNLFLGIPYDNKTTNFIIVKLVQHSKVISFEFLFGRQPGLPAADRLILRLFLEKRFLVI